MRLRFGEFEVDLDRYEVRHGTETRHLEPQVFEVLTYLARHRDRLVSKEELLDEVWGNRFVSESALTSRIRAARAVLDDNGRDQRVIRTVHGRGYRFVADVTDVTDPVAVPDRPALPGPWRAALAGDHGGAAGGWQALHERYEQAVETWAAGDHDAAAAMLEGLGATGTLRRLERAG